LKGGSINCWAFIGDSYSSLEKNEKAYVYQYNTTVHNLENPHYIQK